MGGLQKLKSLPVSVMAMSQEAPVPGWHWERITMGRKVPSRFLTPVAGLLSWAEGGGLSHQLAAWPCLSLFCVCLGPQFSHLHIKWLDLVSSSPGPGSDIL